MLVKDYLNASVARGSPFKSASESPLCLTDTVITRAWGPVLPWEGGVWAFFRCLARIRGHPVIPDWVLSHCEQCSWGSVPRPRK